MQPNHSVMYVHSLGESSQDTIVKKQKSDFGDNGMHMCIHIQCIYAYVTMYVCMIVCIRMCV